MCFLIWMAYGVYLAKTSHKLRARLAAMPRIIRALLGALTFFGGTAILFGGVFAIARAGGFPPGGMLPWAWAAVAGLGLVFIHLEIVGLASLLTLALDSGVTSKRSEESDKP